MPKLWTASTMPLEFYGHLNINATLCVCAEKENSWLESKSVSNKLASTAICACDEVFNMIFTSNI